MSRSSSASGSSTSSTLRRAKWPWPERSRPVGGPRRQQRGHNPAGSVVRNEPTAVACAARTAWWDADVAHAARPEVHDRPRGQRRNAFRGKPVGTAMSARRMAGRSNPTVILVPALAPCPCLARFVGVNDCLHAITDTELHQDCTTCVFIPSVRTSSRASSAFEGPHASGGRPPLAIVSASRPR
jgi:hypothetical protein